MEVMESLQSYKINQLSIPKIGHIWQGEICLGVCGCESMVPRMMLNVGTTCRDSQNPNKTERNLLVCGCVICLLQSAITEFHHYMLNVYPGTKWVGKSPKCVVSVLRSIGGAQETVAEFVEAARHNILGNTDFTKQRGTNEEMMWVRSFYMHVLCIPSLDIGCASGNDRYAVLERAIFVLLVSFIY